FFWLGKALRSAGDASGAASAWASARSADPYGFYGLRATDQLAGLADPRAQVDRTLPAVSAHADDDPIAAILAWAASRGDASAAQQLHVDPLLFSSLMRQESNMDQAIESSAQARGMSQLIASTGYDAARALGQYGFRGSDLFKPKISLTLGGFTFGQRLTRYDQRIFPALAAYNAPQFAVDGWLLAAGEADIDTFAEAIPFTETYPYVQRIYENYTQYLDLYRF